MQLKPVHLNPFLSISEFSRSLDKKKSVASTIRLLTSWRLVAIVPLDTLMGRCRVSQLGIKWIGVVGCSDDVTWCDHDVTSLRRKLLLESRWAPAAVRNTSPCALCCCLSDCGASWNENTRKMWSNLKHREFQPRLVKQCKTRTHRTKTDIHLLGENSR